MKKNPAVLFGFGCCCQRGLDLLCGCRECCCYACEQNKDKIVERGKLPEEEKKEENTNENE
jgi:hypothetical protein